MPNWKYEFRAGDDAHVLTANWNYLTGKQTVQLDQQVLFDKVNWKPTHAIDLPLEGHRATLTLKATALVIPGAALVIDGQPVEPTVGSSGGPPPWVWLFAVPCFAMPILTLGGAIPGALGFGAGAACMGIGGNAELPVAARVLLCALIVGSAWGALILVVGGVAMLQSG